MFTHEIAHRPTGFRAFGFVWNALAGVPLLLPSFLYGDHKGHHANHSYGTSGDPEYLVKSAHSPIRRLLFLLLAFVYPVLPVIRFLVLAPLALVSHRLDRLVWIYASSLYVMNEMYRRDVDRGAAAASRWTQELACAAWAWTLMILIARGALPPGTTMRLYLVMASWMFINQLRTLASHRYGNESGAGMSALEQVLDTNTFARGRVLPNLWAPLGMRYHALHHLLPSLPYHAMPEAHRRLVAALPASSPYHQTLKRGLWSALALPAGATSPDPR